MKTRLGDVIRARRAEARKTLRSTARESRISASLLSLIEQNKHVASRQVIERLATVLDADADRWCGLAGKITAEAEESLAKLARERPEFFREFRAVLDRRGVH